MSVCAQITNLTADLSDSVGSAGPVTGGQGLLLSNTPLDECTGLILLSADDYTKLMLGPTLSSLFDQYFGFDPQLFEYIVGSTIVAYILGHSVGAIVKLMRST